MVVAAVAALGCHQALNQTAGAQQAEGWTAWWTEVSEWVYARVEVEEEEAAWAAL